MIKKKVICLLAVTSIIASTIMPATTAFAENNKQKEEVPENIETIENKDDNSKAENANIEEKADIEGETDIEGKTAEENGEYTVTADKAIEDTKSNTRASRAVSTPEKGFVLDPVSGIQLRYNFRSDGTAAVCPNNTVPSSIIKPDDFSGVFHIPSTVEYKGDTYTVTELSEYAASGWGIEIVLPDTITTIGDQALRGITNREIVIPASVTKMGSKVVDQEVQVRLVGMSLIEPIDASKPNEWWSDKFGANGEVGIILCDNKAVWEVQRRGAGFGGAVGACYESENKIRFYDATGQHIPSLDYTYLVSGSPSNNLTGWLFTRKKVDGIWVQVVNNGAQTDGNIFPNVPSNTQGYNAWAKAPNAFDFYGAGDGPVGRTTENDGVCDIPKGDTQLNLYPTWVFGTAAPVDQGYTLEKVYDGTETAMRFNTVGPVAQVVGTKYTFRIIGKKGGTTLFDEYPTSPIINREFEKATNVADSGTYSVQAIFTDTQYESTSGVIGFDPDAVPWKTRAIISKVISNTSARYNLKITPATAVVKPKTTTSVKWQNQAALPTIELDAGSTDGVITWDAGQTPQIGTKSYSYTYVPNNAYAKNASGKDVANYTNPSVKGTIKVTYASITSVDISPKLPSITRGGTQQMTANVIGVAGPSLDVTWGISGNTSADTKIDTTGKLTIGTDETAGSSITVSATSAYDTSKSAATTVTVLAPTVTSVTVKATPDTVHRGGISQIAATVIGAGHPSQDVDWEISGHTSADTKIDADGKLTIGTDETAGASILVKATSTYDTSKSATTTVEVLAPTVTSLTVNATPDKVHRGNTSQIAAAVVGAGHPSQDVTWEISGHTSADTKIEADGQLTIGADETAAATITVTATSTYDESKSSTTTVEVLAPTVTSVTTEATPDTVHRGDTSQITATVVGDGHPSQDVTWEISGHTSADTKIDANGQLTIGADETVAATITVTATSTYDASKSSTATVEVLEPYITEVETPFDTLRIVSGTQEKIDAVVRGIGYPNLDIIWEIAGNTSDETAISHDGELTIARSEKAGDQIMIKAISKTDNTKFTTIKIVVTSTVHFDSLGGSEVADYTDVLKGTIKEPAKPTFKDYVLTGWYKDKGYQEKWDFENSILDENLILYAKWETYKLDTDEDSQKVGNVVFDKSKDLENKLYIDNVTDKMDIVLPELRGVYDIYLLNGKDRVKVEDEKIKITLLLEEEEKGFTHYKVVYINDDGDFVEEYQPILSQDKNSLSFETTHLSYYGIVAWNDKEPEIIKPGQSPSQPKAGGTTVPQTGDTTSMILWNLMLLTSMGVGVAAFIMRRRKKQASKRKAML